MYHKIDEVLAAQMRLIEPIMVNGTLPNIRNTAELEYEKIKNLRHELEYNKNDDVTLNKIIVKNLSLIISVFSNIYSKLGDDSRKLPTVNLRKCAIDEMNAVMSIWNKLPS